MNFNLTDAIAVKEREDGLLEKDAFDLSTAMPVENNTKPPETNWELLKDPSFKADWELVKKSAIGQTKDIYNLLIGRPLASITGQPQPELESLPEVLPNLVKVLSSDIPIPPLSKQNIEGVLTGKGIVEPYQEGLEGNLDVLGGLLTLWGANAAIKSFKGAIQYNKNLDVLMKSQLVTPEQAIAQNIAQDLSKYEKIFVGEGTGFAPGTPGDIKVKTIMGNLKDNPKLQAEVMTDTALRVKGINPNSITETTGFAIEEGAPSNIFGKLKRLNQLVGETGSIPITRAKVGQRIVFEGRPGEIVSVEGERLGIQLLGEQGRTVVAMASQLSLPKVEEVKPQPTEGKVDKGILKSISREFDSSDEVTGRELFHTTPEKNLDNIIKNGLTIGNKGRFDESVRGGLYFAERIRKAAEFIEESDNPVYLRIKGGVDTLTETLKGELGWDKLGGTSGSVKTNVNIPPEYLEIKTKKGWVDLLSLSTPTGEGQEMVTLYHASPKLPTKGNWRKGTMFADTEQNARYYAESHHEGDIKVQKVSIPKNLVEKNKTNNIHILKEEYPIAAGEGQKPPVEPPKTAVSGMEEPEPIKINNLKISPEAKKKIKTTIEEVRPELEKVKGDVLTQEEILEAAKTSDILTSATSREATKTFEAKLLRTRQHLAALAEKEGISPEFIETLKAVRAAGTDLARGLGSLRIEATGEEFNLKTRIVNKLSDMGVEVDKIVKAAEGIDFNNQEQVTKFYRQFVKPKMWDVINEYRYINLLSSPKTHIVNAFSNMIQVAGLAPGTKLIMGDIPGVKAFYKGAWGAIGEAGSKALDALKGKTFVERPDVKHIPTGVGWLKAGRYIPQALEAGDVFFRTIAFEGEKAAQLEKGVELKEAEKIAKEKASYFVFRKALDPKNKTGQGKLLSAIDDLTALIYKARSIPIIGRAVGWYLPFVQTPMNIAKQMIEYSPAGFSTLPGAKNKKEQLAKTFLGSLIFGLAAYLVSENESTWAVPTNKKEKDLFFAAGRQPFSIKIGDTWVGYSRLGPLALPISIPAAIKHYTTQNPNSATDTAMQKTSKVVGGLGEFFASMSYVEGIGQLMNLVKNAPGAASKLVAETPSQLIPLSSLQRWINNFIIDPIYRKTDKELSAEAIIDNARKSIIFGTKGLPAYENPEGDESRRSYPGLNAFSPIPVTKSNREYEEEFKEYIEERKETLIDKKESEDEPKRRARRRRN